MLSRIGARLGMPLGIVVLVLLWGSPGHAHGGASVTIHSDGRGSVWITAQWQDGHPINEPTPVTLTAVPSSGGSPVPPATLRQTGDERGTQTYGGTLEPGTWQVSIDLAAPVDGHCQALVQVAAAGGASPRPVEVACLIPATGSSAAAARDGADGADGGSLTPLWFTLGGLAAAGAVVAGVLARRRDGGRRRGAEQPPSEGR